MRGDALEQYGKGDHAGDDGASMHRSVGDQLAFAVAAMTVGGMRSVQGHGGFRVIAQIAFRMWWRQAAPPRDFVARLAGRLHVSSQNINGGEQGAPGALSTDFAQMASAALARSARLRSLGSSRALRRRIDFGVTSTSSSSWM